MRIAKTLLLLIALPVCAGETIFDIREFGAKCDGTSDDAAAVQSAIDKAPDGALVLISGKCGIGAAGLNLKKRNSVTVKGMGAGSGFKALAATSQPAQGFGPVMLLIQQCKDCVIKDLTFEMENVGECGIGFDRCEACTAQGNVINNTGYPGNGAIVGTGDKNNKYLCNSINKTGNGTWLKDGKPVNDATRGMWIGNVADNEREWNPLIEGNVLRDISATAIATVAVAAVIRNNIAEDVQGAGVKLMPGSNPGQSIVEHNTLRRNLFHSVQIEGAASDVIIRNNTMEDNEMCGIYIFGGFTHSQITGNTVANNHRSGKGGWMAAVYLHHANDVTIENNFIYDSNPAAQPRQDFGIILNAVSPESIKNVRVKNNTIRNNATHGIGLVHNGGTMDGVTLEANTIAKNSQYGIFIQGKEAIKNIVLTNNVFSQNGLGTLRDERPAELALKPPQ